MHCLTLIDPSWMSFSKNHTRKAICLLRPRRHMLLAIAMQPVLFSYTSVKLSCGKPNSIANLWAHAISQQQLASTMNSASAVLSAMIWERDVEIRGRIWKLCQLWADATDRVWAALRRISGRLDRLLGNAFVYHFVLTRVFVISWNLTIESNSEVHWVGSDCNAHALISCTVGGGLLTYRDLVDQAQDTGKPRLKTLIPDNSLAY